MQTFRLHRFALAAFALTFSSCVITPAEGESIKIINWNVLYGFNHHKSIAQGQGWIQAQQPNVVALQELNGISEQRLAEISSQWGHSYAVTHKETGFPVGLTSNQPIEVLERRSEGFHHGFLHCRTYGIHFFVVHFWPGKTYDVEQILLRAKPLLEQKQRVIILGDFNGCSRKDEDFLIAHAPLRERDYSFVDMVEAAGFEDLVFKHDSAAKISCPSPITIPRWSENMAELKQKQYRIDFVFADHNLAAHSSSGTISLDAKIDSISDHYPVLVEFRLPQ